MNEELTQNLKSVCLIRILDDDADVRKALSFLLRTQGWCSKAYSTYEEFVADDVPNTPGCLILDIRMPGKSGFEVQQLLNSRSYPIPIIFLTGYGDVEVAVLAMQNGAVDFLQKPVNSEKLLKSIERFCTFSAQRALPLSFPCLMEIQEKIDRLSSREKEIIDLIRKGLTSKAISERQGLSEKTIENHRSSACKKLQTSNVSEILLLYEKLKL